METHWLDQRIENAETPHERAYYEAIRAGKPLTEAYAEADEAMPGRVEPALDKPAGRYIIVARARARSAPADEDTVLVRIRECPQTPFATFLTPRKGGSLVAGNYFEHPEFAVADWRRRATRDTATVAPHKALRALRRAA